MAIAIPLLMMAAGAGTAAIAATTLVLAVTGISAKINSAASKVFGEDLVKAANIVGGVYLAYTSVTAGGGAEAAAGEGADAAGAAADTALPSATDAATTSVVDPGSASALAPDVSVGTTGAGGSTAVADAAATSTTAPTVTANGTAAADFAGHQPVAQQAATSADQVSGFNTATDAVSKAASNSTNAQVKGWWDSLSAQERAAVMQTGGTMLSGALSGYAQGKKADQEMELAKMRLQNQSTTVNRVAPARVTTATPGALRVR